MRVVIEDVSAGYGRRPVVGGIDLTIEAGAWLGLIGPNGAGKSTMLATIAGLLEPIAGTIRLGGNGLLDRGALARTVALVPQSPVLPPTMTVGEYVLLGRSPHIPYLGRESRHDLAVATSTMHDLDLLDLAGRPLGELSGGEQQRAVLARALTQQPGLLLLDEPTTALDIGQQLHALERIDRLRTERGLTVVAAMHDLTHAARFSDTIAFMAGGRIVAHGPAAAVLTTEELRRHYGEGVRVVTVDGEIVVLPSRSDP